MSRRQHARRRRSYGRRQHELRERRSPLDSDETARESMYDHEYEGGSGAQEPGHDGGRAA